MLQFLLICLWLWPILTTTLLHWILSFLLVDLWGCHHISDIQVSGHHHRQQTEQEAQIHFLKKLRSLIVCSKILETFYGWCTFLCCGLLGGAASEPATLTDTTNWLGRSFLDTFTIVARKRSLIRMLAIMENINPPPLSTTSWKETGAAQLSQGLVLHECQR